MMPVMMMIVMVIDQDYNDDNDWLLWLSVWSKYISKLIVYFNDLNDARDLPTLINPIVVIRW